MNPNSYVNLLQLVNMCILNLSEKKNLRKKEKKKNLLSWAVSISVFGYLCAFVFYFCALIIINGLLYKKRRSECFPFTHLISKQKKYITFFKTEKSAA